MLSFLSITIEMFSEDDIETFRITVELPKREEHNNLVEQLIMKSPLTTLKPSPLWKLVVTLKETIGELPIMILKGPNASLNLSDKEMTLEIGKEAEASVGEKKEAPKPFSEDSLRRITNDFNFLYARILEVLKVETLKAKFYFSVVQKTDTEIRFDAFFSQNFWDSFKEFEGMHVKGISAEPSLLLAGLKTPCRIRLSQEEKEVTGRIVSDFEIKGPVEIALMVKERLEVINTFYKKVTV